MFGCQNCRSCFSTSAGTRLIHVVHLAALAQRQFTETALWCQFIFGWHAEIRSKNPYKYFHKLSDLNISSDGKTNNEWGKEQKKAGTNGKQKNTTVKFHWAIDICCCDTRFIQKHENPSRGLHFISSNCYYFRIEQILELHTHTGGTLLNFGGTINVRNKEPRIVAINRWHPDVGCFWIIGKIISIY